jgi:hypothetical protein
MPTLPQAGPSRNIFILKSSRPRPKDRRQQVHALLGAYQHSLQAQDIDPNSPRIKVSVAPVALPPLDDGGV